jgi:peptide deformylase
MRTKEITVNAYNLRGEEIKAHLSGMLARVVQHEYDHLDGVLFVDRMSTLAKAKVEHVLEEFAVEFQSRRNVGQIPDDATIAKELAQWEQRYC